MKSSKFNWSAILAVILMLGTGALCGAQMAAGIDALSGLDGGMSDWMLMALMLVVLYAAMLLHIVLHEGGHLVAGLMSGYRFASFRVGSLMLLREDGRLRVKRFSLAGTGGQCLMDPPELKDGAMPYRLYNLGGSLMNLLTAALALALRALCADAPLADVSLLIFAEIGLVFALINGVPLRIGTVDNDGYNALSMGRSPGALRSLWVQLKVNSAQQQGLRLRDMPPEWFVAPADEDMGNSMTAALGVLACNRLMDEQDFARADELMARYMDMPTGIAGLHRGLLTCDRICCALIGQGSATDVDALLTRPQRKLMKAMAKYPSVLRTEYALALLHERDLARAERIAQQFERIARSYPYAGELQGERELMAIIGDCAGLQQRTD